MTDTQLTILVFGSLALIAISFPVAILIVDSVTDKMWAKKAA